ncbi:hypothetical protein [Hymenobacter sp. IS2118]|uniref:hypothetical protein n=1 Tax=Hymenobacter sp. IS2118 TaxID=1505605 RepID=UPI00054D9514|nr:hypothetical protein [Hymenobacter sp. IS2118]
MADRATLGPRLGHFLPYLLRRRLWAVVWPAAAGERTAFLLTLAVLVLYGAGFGLLLASGSSEVADNLPTYVAGLNAAVLLSAFLVDFLPALRPVTRPIPDHLPVSARLSVVTAFLLDLITLRRLTLAAGLLAVLLAAPRYAAVPAFAVLLLLAAAVLSFNVRLLIALRRWRHPLLGLHLASAGLLAWWVSTPAGAYHAALGWAAVLLPWALGAAELYWLGPYFSARYLPTETSAPAGASQLLARLAPESRAYLRKVRTPLLTGLAFKLILLGVVVWLGGENGGNWRKSGSGYFYLVFLPVISFNYVNSNLYGFMSTLVANELHRLGLTARLLGLYGRVVAAVVAVECVLSAAVLLAFFPRADWYLLALLPLGALSLASLGLWGSLYYAKPVKKVGELGSMRKNVSSLVGVGMVLLAAALYFVPWWWLRLLLAALVTLSAVIPVRAVLRNDGNLRRRLWRGISA